MKTNNWKLAASIALLTLCSYAAFAQGDGPPPGPPPDAQSGPPSGDRMPGPERQLKMLTHLLDLTTDQQTGVKALLEQESTQMKALRAKLQSENVESASPETRQARMAQVDQIRDETDTKIAALLNDTQKPKFAEWLQRRKAAMERRRPEDGNPPPPPPDGGAPPPNA
jgi:Spy/CpxP family protein refolding chaperone